jgi:hypothetical protein
MASGPSAAVHPSLSFSQKKLECGNRATRNNGIMVVGYSVLGLQGINDTHPLVGIPAVHEGGLRYKTGLENFYSKV